MSTIDSSGRVAEVLRLGLVEGVPVRAIAERLHIPAFATRPSRRREKGEVPDAC